MYILPLMVGRTPQISNYTNHLLFVISIWKWKNKRNGELSSWKCYTCCTQSHNDKECWYLPSGTIFEILKYISSKKLKIFSVKSQVKWSTDSISKDLANYWFCAIYYWYTSKRLTLTLQENMEVVLKCFYGSLQLHQSMKHEIPLWEATAYSALDTGNT